MTEIDDSEAMAAAAAAWDDQSLSVAPLPAACRAYASNLRQQLAEAKAELERLEKAAREVSSAGMDAFLGVVRSYEDSYDMRWLREALTAYEAAKCPALSTQEPDGAGPFARIAELEKLLNSPQVDDFLQAVRVEAAHQQDRWGADHDAGKADSDWFWLIGYLAGKALRPDNAPEKTLHHIITTAAVCLNWHAHKTGARTRMRPGIDTPKGEVSHG